MIKKLLLGSAFGLLLGAGAIQADVFVRVAPPAAVIERPIPRPGRRHVWVPGYYRWDGRGYVWVRGVWRIPPRRRTVWVEPRWEQGPRGWVFVEGRWR